MLLSETIDMDTAEERWRRLIGIWLRINGKMYAETLNISINLTLNLAILLVKYCKVKPTQAEKLAYYEIYSLYKEKQKGLVKDMQFISEGDTLDLVKLQENNKYDITAVDVPPQTYVKNEAGGFRIQFLNRYIREVLERSKQIGGDLIKDQSCFNKPNMALNISNIGEYIVGGGSDLSYGTFSNAGVEKTELTSGATYNFFRKRRDSKFIEHSWSIQSCVESYQNQQIMESSDGGGLINCRMDLKKMIDTFQEFTTLESLFKFIKKIQDKSQFELRIAEFRGYKGNTNTIEVFCPHRPNCKFQIVYRYFVTFQDDKKMHEKIIFDRIGQLIHFHQERLELYKLDKKYLKKPKRELIP